MDPDRKPSDQEPDNTDQPLDQDERVSGYPLSFQDVVRAMHRTPRTTDKTPKRKPGKEHGDK